MATQYHATVDGLEYEAAIEELADAGRFEVNLGGKKITADLRQAGPASFSVIVGNRSFDLDVIRQGDEFVVVSRSGAVRLTLEDARRRALHSRGSREVSGKVQMRAMMPGRVLSVAVNVGDEVAANQGVLVIEAMKMENELKSPKAGKVVEVKVAPGQTVEKGELLIVIE
ncbi:MAG TPA: biotin/lipoyl-containing protein [Candidatus Binataceae bacterium]|nr:biotin/lipoyl-containing protein [Candidatus Binataceae bacterium]